MSRNLIAAIAAALFAVACASTDGDPLPPIAAPPAVDPRIGELQTALTELLERIDVLNHRLARLEERAAAPASSAAVLTRPQESPRAVAATPPAPPRPAPPQQRALVGAQLADEYRTALMLVGRGSHADARRAFEAIFEADPSGDLADNALFWIGETWYSAGDYASAMRYYRRVVDEYPEQNKAPDALFKTALALERTGDLALARSTLRAVIERFPYSSTASAARRELERIRY